MAAATAPADVAPPAAMAPADVSPLAATPPACTPPADDSPAASPACTTPAELSPPPAYGPPPCAPARWRIARWDILCSLLVSHVLIFPCNLANSPGVSRCFKITSIDAGNFSVRGGIHDRERQLSWAQEELLRSERFFPWTRLTRRAADHVRVTNC